MFYQKKLNVIYHINNNKGTSCKFPSAIFEVTLITCTIQSTFEDQIQSHIENMLHILQRYCATNISLNIDITNPNNLQIARIGDIHRAKVSCFVRRERLPTKSSIIRSTCINNPLSLIICNIQMIICNTQTPLFFTGNNHTS